MGNITKSRQPDLEEVVVVPLSTLLPEITPPGTPSGFLRRVCDENIHSKSAVQQNGDITGPKRKTTGVAFSGGGIRSAAFCSGALRKMLQDDVPLEYLSCVSGGGYTGAAFMDWEYRQGANKDNHKKWHKKFFERMRANAGYMCNWQKPILGVCQLLLLLCLLLFVVFILPCILWLPYALPVAVAVEFLFGEILRQSPICPPGVQQDDRTSMLMMELYDGCQPPVRRVILFAFTLSAALVCYFLSRCTRFVRYKGPFRLLSIFNGLVLVFTLFPWVAHDMMWPKEAWIKFLILFICLVLPFFFPIIRKSAGTFLCFYAYTYIVSWKVFHTELFQTVPYSDEVFYPVLMGCALAFILFPFIGSLHQSLFNIYYRYRLSNAFFMHDARFRCADVFPWCVGPIEGISKYIKGYEFRRVCETDDELTLQDLDGLSPTFISNITVNDWQTSSEAKSSHHLMSFSSEGVKLIGSDVEKESSDLTARFHPHHIKLSAAMAISGAAVSYDMGGYQSRLDMVLELFALLGIRMGDEMVCDQCPAAKTSWTKKYIIPILVEIACISPLILIPFAYWLGNDKCWVNHLVLLHMAVAVLLASLAVLNTGSIQPGKMERFVRWCVTRIFFVRFLRGFLNINNVGMEPPPVLRVSDGGHFENLALLPLLDKKLKKIVIFDGSCNPGDDNYADALLNAIKMAREKLHCSFVGRDGRDINEDIRANFVKTKSQHRPRSYRFRVIYHDEDDNKTGEGEILFVAPRHPSEGMPLKREVNEEPKPWKTFDAELGDLDHKNWGKGPEITKHEADRLTGCCCLCCHRNSCQYMSTFFVGGFPHHITANQFFTPDTFSAYHREGYAACVEADVTEFLKKQSTQESYL
ncbi:hypothetical protein ACROYT_G039584 [Oculina patagonica]